MRSVMISSVPMNSVTLLPIDSDIPPPPEQVVSRKYMGRPVSPTLATLRALEVGQSFVAQLSVSCSWAMISVEQRLSGKRYRSKKTPKGLRIWRTR